MTRCRGRVLISGVPTDSTHHSRAYIAFGSNLGDRHALLLAARQRLGSTAGITLTAFSSLYESEPCGGPEGQGHYLNAVAEIHTNLSPPALLQLLLSIEGEAGRERSVRWGARTLDLDLLFYDDLILKTATLILPHPRLHERAFVLLPCREIAPGLVHPVYGRTISELCTEVDLSGLWQAKQRW